MLKYWKRFKNKKNPRFILADASGVFKINLLVMTNLRQFSIQNDVPAGIFSGTKAFWFEGEKWVSANETFKRFADCESSIQQPIWRAFLADKQSHASLAKIGITKASEAFERWYQCVAELIPDANLTNKTI